MVSEDNKKYEKIFVRTRENNILKGTVNFGDVFEEYDKWDAPIAIISDGPYGLSKYPGEPRLVDLAEWYVPHLEKWSEKATPQTTLWFWSSEIAWAEVHPVIKKNGWKYKGAHIWNKGIGHIAGNCNSNTIRQFPVVTEICVRYVRDVGIPNSKGNSIPVQEWFYNEWKRSGIPFYKANEACGVKNAATRKYLTLSDMWYLPPLPKIEALARYANEHGKPTDIPYFSIDEHLPSSFEEYKKTGIKLKANWENIKEDWEKTKVDLAMKRLVTQAELRAKWNHVHGVTNVWEEPSVRGKERIVDKSNGSKILHPNQKPLKLMRRIIEASTDCEDLVWEPFGGLCSGFVASLQTGRRCCASEIVPKYFKAISQRVRSLCEDILLDFYAE